MNTEVQKELQPNWSFRDEIAIINGIAIKGGGIIMPTLLQVKAIKQIYINHMDTEKRMLGC